MSTQQQEEKKSKEDPDDNELITTAPLVSNVLVLCETCTQFDGIHDADAAAPTTPKCPIRAKYRQQVDTILTQADKDELYSYYPSDSDSFNENYKNHCTIGAIERMEVRALKSALKSEEKKSVWTCDSTFVLSIPELGPSLYPFPQGAGEDISDKYPDQHLDQQDLDFTGINVQGHRINFHLNFKHQRPVVTQEITRLYRQDRIRKELQSLRIIIPEITQRQSIKRRCPSPPLENPEKKRVRFVVKA
jgi:hypothetical protein